MIELWDELNENGIRLLTIGDDDGLPESCQDELREAKEKTAGNTEFNLILALNYSARWEMVKAVRAIIAQQIPEQNVTADVIAQNLSTANIPDP